MLGVNSFTKGRGLVMRFIIRYLVYIFVFKYCPAVWMRWLHSAPCFTISFTGFNSCFSKPSCSHDPFPSYLAPQQRKEMILFDWPMLPCPIHYLFSVYTNPVKLSLLFQIRTEWGSGRVAVAQGPLSGQLECQFWISFADFKTNFHKLLYAFLPSWLYFYLSGIAWPWILKLNFRG